MGRWLCTVRRVRLHSVKLFARTTTDDWMAKPDRRYRSWEHYYRFLRNTPEEVEHGVLLAPESMSAS